MRYDPPEKHINVMDFLPRRAEANLQAELYHQCRLRNIPIFLEYCSRWNDYAGVRMDAVIHKDGKIRALCEIKKSPNPEKRRRTWIEGRQGRSYKSWNLPIFLILSEKDFPEIWAFWAEINPVQPEISAGPAEPGTEKKPTEVQSS